MQTVIKFFWQNLRGFAEQTACTDTSTGKTASFSELETDTESIANKIKLSNKGIIFLFTTNSYNCIAAYLGILKSGNAVLLLDEKLNDEIRSVLIKTYNPEFIITSNKNIAENYSLDFKNDSLHC